MSDSAMPDSYMKKVNEKAQSAAEQRAKTERNIIHKFLPLLQSEAAKASGANVETLIAAFHRIVKELEKANKEVAAATKGRSGVPFPADLLPELHDIIKTETKTEEALHLFVRKLAMRTGYEKKAFTSYRLSIVEHIKTIIAERYMADAIVGGKMLLDTSMAAATYKSTLDRTLKRIATAYAKVCDDEAENQAVKLMHAQMMVDKPTTTLAQASAAYFAAIEAKKAIDKTKALEERKKKHDAEVASETTAEAVPAGPPPVDMPEDNEKCPTKAYAEGNLSVIVGETGGFPNSTKMTIFSPEKEFPKDVLLTKDGNKVLVDILMLLILKATCCIIQYKSVKSGDIAFGSVNSKGAITDIDEAGGSIDAPISSFFKVSTYSFFTIGFDGTNTTMLLYSLKKGIVSAEESELTVPFEVKDIKMWAGKPSTLLITGSDQQFLWAFKEPEESDATPHAGAGKPFNFSKPLNKIGEVSEDSSLLADDDDEAAAASEMEEDV
jgi:hypothetical protein